MGGRAKLGGGYLGIQGMVVSWRVPTLPHHDQQARRVVTFLPSQWAPAHMVLVPISLGRRQTLKKKKKEEMQSSFEGSPN